MNLLCHQLLYFVELLRLVRRKRKKRRGYLKKNWKALEFYVPSSYFIIPELLEVSRKISFFDEVQHM